MPTRMNLHPVPESTCSLCGLEQLAYYRDWAERPIGICCIRRAVLTTEGVDFAAIWARIARLADER